MAGGANILIMELFKFCYKLSRSYIIYPMKYKKIFYCLTLVFFSACNQPEKYISTPEEQIVQELSQRRIIMLGDFAHGFPLPYHSLILTLSTWLTMLEKGESYQNHLTLFLEEDRQITDLLKLYIKNGDLEPFLDFVLPYTSIERLEFYSDLRRISKRIDSLNGSLSPSKQISFDIQGPEPMNVFDPRMIDSSARASMLFFVNERDSLTALNVIIYLNEHPNQKGLMFFGNAHLIKNMVRKDHSGTLTPDESKGMFLGWYLKRAFGDSQVFTISQVAQSRSPIKQDEFGESDIFILSSDVPWIESPPNGDNLVPEYYDAFVIRNGFVLQDHPLQYIFSGRTIRASLKKLELLEPHQMGAMGNRFYQKALRTLEFLYDTSFSTNEEWRLWCLKIPFDGLERLRSENFKKHISNKSSEALGTQEFFKRIDDLIYLGFDPRIGSPAMSRIEWNRYLDSMWKQIVFLNEIGVYFIGDSTEKVTAKAYLVKSSGQNYNDPALYCKWWRKNYFGVNY